MYIDVTFLYPFPPPSLMFDIICPLKRFPIEFKWVIADLEAAIRGIQLC